MLDIGDSTAVGRRIPADRIPRAAVVVRALVGGVGALLLIALYLLTPPDNTRYFVLFLVAAVVADLLFTLRVSGTSYAVSNTFIFAYIAVGGTVATALLAVAARILAWAIRRGLRTPSTTMLYQFFSVGEAALVTLAAGGLAILMASGPLNGIQEPNRTVLGLIIFGVLHFVFSVAITALVAAARGLAAVRPFLVPSVGTWPATSLAISLPLSIALVLIARTEAGVITSVALVLAVLGVISLIVRLNVRLRERTGNLTVVNRIGTRLAAALESADLLRILARESRRVLGWDGFVIATVDPANAANLNLVFLTGEGEEIAHRVIAREHGLLGEAVRKGETVQWERSGTESDEGPEAGVRKPWSVVVAPMRFDEEVIGAVAIQSTHSEAWDERHVELLETMASQAAVALRNAELFRREQQARQELDEFFSVVTHEIRNPLTTIRGYSDLLAGSEHPDVSESAAIIRDETQKILRLADDLLDAGRAAEGRFSITLEEVDVVPLLGKIVDRWRASSSREIGFRADTKGVIARADAARLGQVVENLLSNAVKYTRSGDSIRVQVLTRRERSVAIMVEDSGPGIPPEKSSRLFERFYRVDGNSEVKGTGLGLHIAREIIRAHGGDLTYRRAPGGGSIFTIELPLVRGTDGGGAPS